MSDEKQEQQIKNLMDSYRKVFNSASGRVVMADLMRRGYFTVATPATTNLAAQRAEGQRELVLYILNMVVDDPNQVIKQFRDLKQKRDPVSEYFRQDEVDDDFGTK